MSAFKSTVAAAVLLALPFVNAGPLNIVNQCSFPAYYKETADQDSAVQTIAGNGGSAALPYTAKADGGGPSIKVGTTPDVAHNILQLEYTMTPATIFYDLSNIDGLPFQNHDVHLSTNQANCPSVTCVAGSFCTDAYNVPSDNHATKACQADGTTTTLTLCSDGNAGNSGNAGDDNSLGSVVGGVVSAVNNAVVPPAANTPSPSPTPVAQPVQPAPVEQPTTLSTSVVPAAPTADPSPSVAAAPAAAPAPAAPAVDSAPVPVQVPATTDESADDGSFSPLHYPASWGRIFGGDVDNFTDSKPKRSLRVHRHHRHLAARDSA